MGFLTPTHDGLALSIEKFQLSAEQPASSKEQGGYILSGFYAILCRFL
jgi:hypothetical protein